LGCVEVVAARDVLRELALVRVVRDPAVAGLRLVAVRFVVDAGFDVPGVVVAMCCSLPGVIEHVFVNHSVVAVTANEMKSS
jgi:hypothetical protein